MKRPQWIKAELDRLVEEATIDCYNESEQVCGLNTMIEDNLAVPLQARIFGISVVVEQVDLTNHDEIVVVCRRGRERQHIALIALPLPSPPPARAEWIAAYRRWVHPGR